MGCGQCYGSEVLIYTKVHDISYPLIPTRVATGYGQPSSTFYDWTLSHSAMNDGGFRLPPEVERRLLIEKFSNRVTKALYSNHSDPVGLVNGSERSVLIRFLSREYEELEQTIQQYDPSRTSDHSLFTLSLWALSQLNAPCLHKSLFFVPVYGVCFHCFRLTDVSAISTLYLRAAGLHFRLSAFFDSPTSKDYSDNLLRLWLATTSFLEIALNLEISVGKILLYSTNYILQMITAAGFALLKLLNSFFANDVDFEYGRKLFTDSISAIRLISVKPNDLPSRLAEVLAQLWRGSGAASRKAQVRTESSDSALQLKVKCRMSMSLVYDSVWRWREEFQAQGRGNLDCKPPTSRMSNKMLKRRPTAAVKNPTNPDSAVESSANSVADHSTAPSNMLGDTMTPDGFGESNYEVFDPLNWMLDGLVDFPYSLGEQIPDLQAGDMI